MIKGRSGFLLAEETLKMILALIAIGFLAYLLFSLYNANQDSKNLELAKASLDSLSDAIDDQQAEILIYNPEGWWIASWPLEGTLPDSCSNLGWENCICIFEPGWKKYDPIRDYNVGDFKDYSDSDDGYCLQTSEKIEISPFGIDTIPLALKINYGSAISVTK